MSEVARPSTPCGTAIHSKDREDWLTTRKGWLGASEIGSLFGVADWDSPYSLWAGKSGLADKEVEQTTGMRRGTRFESALAEEVKDILGWKIELWPQTAFLAHDEPDYLLGCTPDCVIEDDEGRALGDFKLASEFNRKHWREEPPAVYQMQMQAQMAVTGIERGYLLVCFGLQDEITPVRVDYHQGFQDEMQARVKAFWRMVEEGTAPEVDGKDATFAALKQLYPEDDGSTVVLTGEEEFAAMDYGVLTDQIKELKDKQTIAKAKLIQAIGDATYASCPGGSAFSYKAGDRRTIETKLLRKTHPDIAVEVTRTTSTRTLRRLKQLPKGA